MDSGSGQLGLRLSPGPTKKRKADGGDRNGSAGASGSGSGGAGTDGKKRPVSCDVCRARKVKCVKPEGAERCDGCVSLDQVCSYTHERKKPGPANSFARKPSPSRDFYASLDPGRHYSQDSIRSDYAQQAMPPPPTRWSSDHSQIQFGQYPFDFNGNNVQQPEPTMDLPWLPISPNSLLHPQPGEVDSASEGSPMGRWLHNTMAVNEWEQALFGPLPPSDPPSAGGSSSNRPDQAAPVPGMPTKKSRVEDIVAWSVIMKILHAYHAHLYPLMPIVHWPTFSQQLVAREDEKSDTWRAFLLSLVTYSIIQLPRSALTFLPVKDLRRLHQRCHIESRRLQNRKFSDVSLVDVSTLYCDHIYLGTLGRGHAANIILAEAIRLAQIINLHDERLGEPVYNVVERETRRRVFWLLYGSDRTITALTSNPLHIHECDLYIPLPMAIDDNLLTSAGAFPQPPHTTPVLAGFHFASRLFRLLGAVLTAHRQLLSPPLDGIHLPQLPPMHRPASHFLDELERVLTDLPGPLQLVNPVDGTPKSEAQREKGEAAFGICRANLLVSQAMVRFAIRQYARAVGEEDGVEEKAWAERDVLGLLESMSSESLAANGESLRHKVLFVASSLLEKYPSTAEGHSYVTDFLAVYSRINQEQHASLLDAESAAPSRDVSPGYGGPSHSHNHSHGHIGGLHTADL